MTKRRRTFLFAGLGLLTLAVVIIGLVLALRHEPALYRHRALEAGPAREVFGAPQRERTQRFVATLGA